MKLMFAWALSSKYVNESLFAQVNIYFALACDMWNILIHIYVDFVPMLTDEVNENDADMPSFQWHYMVFLEAILWLKRDDKVSQSKRRGNACSWRWEIVRFVIKVIYLEENVCNFQIHISLRMQIGTKNTN